MVSHLSFYFPTPGHAPDFSPGQAHRHGGCEKGIFHSRGQQTFSDATTQLYHVKAALDIYKQTGMAVFQYNFIYKTREGGWDVVVDLACRP